MVILLIGIDGSGKSTTIGLLKERGWTGVELSAEPVVMEWKKRGIAEPITLEFIQSRQNDILAINQKLNETVLERAESGQLVVTSQHEIVTNLTHEIMREQTSLHSSLPQQSESDSPQSADSTPHRTDPALDLIRWINDSAVRPDAIFVQYAPAETIADRLSARAANV